MAQALSLEHRRNCERFGALNSEKRSGSNGLIARARSAAAFKPVERSATPAPIAQTAPAVCAIVANQPPTKEVG